MKRNVNLIYPPTWQLSIRTNLVITRHFLRLCEKTPKLVGRLWSKS